MSERQGFFGAPASRLREQLRSDAPRLLRVHRRLSIEDPWALMLSPALDGRLVAGWSSADGSMTALAVGAARSIRPTGDARFRAAAALWSELTGRCAELPWGADDEIVSEAPLIFGGFSFSTSGAWPSAEWAAWGDGMAWVPELLVLRRGAEVVAVLAASLSDDADTAHERLMDTARLLQRLLEQAPTKAPVPALAGKNGMSRTGRDEGAWEAWRDRVAAAHAGMRSRDMLKVVLARAETYESIASGDFDSLATALALRTQQARCTTFVVRRPDGEAFAGATPEELVRLHGRELTTVAMAGTRSRGWDEGNDATLAASLMDSAKDRREQLLVTQAIREALAPVTESLEIPETPELARFADVQHLRTCIRARTIQGVSLFELVERLHPTPAVGGLPRPSAMAWLDRHEGMDRGWYAGPIGWVSPSGGGVFAVAIRSALVRGGAVTAYAGCGLVERSDARAEWEETIIKLKPISRALAFRPRE
jgi:isochorismate synthase